MNQSNPYPFQLLDVRLYEALIERLEPDEPVEVEDEAQLPLTFNLNIIKHSDRRVLAFLTLDIKGPTEQAPEFRLRFTLQGLFEVQGDLDSIEQDLWQEFEDLSAAFLLWPYARECMQGFACRMREDIPPLPTLHRLSKSPLSSEQAPAEASSEDN